MKQYSEPSRVIAEEPDLQERLSNDHPILNSKDSPTRNNRLFRPPVPAYTLSAISLLLSYRAIEVENEILSYLSMGASMVFFVVGTYRWLKNR